MTAAEFLKQKGIEDKVLNREDLPKYWVTLSTLMEDYKCLNNLTKEKTFTTKEIRKKLLEINPQVKENSKYTNPFLYDDVKKWYDELGK